MYKVNRQSDAELQLIRIDLKALLNNQFKWANTASSNTQNIKTLKNYTDVWKELHN